MTGRHVGEKSRRVKTGECAKSEGIFGWKKNRRIESVFVSDNELVGNMVEENRGPDASIVYRDEKKNVGGILRYF